MIDSLANLDFSLANKKNIEQDHYFYKLLIFTIIFL